MRNADGGAVQPIDYQEHMTATIGLPTLAQGLQTPLATFNEEQRR